MGTKETASPMGGGRRQTAGVGERTMKRAFRSWTSGNLRESSGRCGQDIKCDRLQEVRLLQLTAVAFFLTKEINSELTGWNAEAVSK